MFAPCSRPLYLERDSGGTPGGRRPRPRGRADGAELTRCTRGVERPSPNNRRKNRLLLPQMGLAIITPNGYGFGYNYYPKWVWLLLPQMSLAITPNGFGYYPKWVWLLPQMGLAITPNNGLYKNDLHHGSRSSSDIFAKTNRVYLLLRRRRPTRAHNLKRHDREHNHDQGDCGKKYLFPTETPKKTASRR